MGLSYLLIVSISGFSLINRKFVLTIEGG